MNEDVEALVEAKGLAKVKAEAAVDPSEIKPPSEMAPPPARSRRAQKAAGSSAAAKVKKKAGKAAHNKSKPKKKQKASKVQVQESNTDERDPEKPGEEEQLWEPTKIVGLQKNTKGKMCFLVKWKGWENDEPTMELESSVETDSAYNLLLLDFRHSNGGGNDGGESRRWGSLRTTPKATPAASAGGPDIGQLSGVDEVVGVIDYTQGGLAVGIDAAGEGGLDSSDDEYEDLIVPPTVFDGIPEPLLLQIIGCLGRDPHGLAKYRRICRWFNVIVDRCVRQVSMTGMVRLAMARANMAAGFKKLEEQPLDTPGERLLWTVLHRFGETTEHLDLRDTPHLRHLGGLRALRNLKTVNCNACWSLEDISGLRDCEQLVSVSFNGCSKLTATSLNQLAYCKQLKTVDIRYCNALNFDPGSPDTDPGLLPLLECKALTRVMVPPALEYQLEPLTRRRPAVEVVTGP